MKSYLSGGWDGVVFFYAVFGKGKEVVLQGRGEENFVRFKSPSYHLFYRYTKL